jgi:hypothetical protein
MGFLSTRPKAEHAKIDAAIAVQEALRGIMADAQLGVILYFESGAPETGRECRQPAQR